MSQAQPALIPVTVLTGFLGAGKTTLLNRILQAQHGHKIAVIENELGEQSIDNELLVREAGEHIVEMNNGCVCCTVRGDLLRILSDLAQKQRSGALQFERVIIETTGLANPGPVTQTFFVDDAVAEHYLLDGVVTVVDAKHGQETLNQQAEAQGQVGFADRILLSKTDLVSTAELEALQKRLVQMNPRAKIKPVAFGETDISDLLDIRGFNLNTILDVDPNFLAGQHAHNHAGDVSAFVFNSTKAFDSERLEEFLGAITQIYGQDLLRYKGILNLKGNARRVIFQGVHMLMGTDLGPAWGTQERASKMVFIGRKLPRELIQKGLEQCLTK